MDGLIMRQWHDLANGMFAEYVLNGFKALERTDLALGREPILLGYFPPARMNKFQALLYSQALETGVIATPISSVDHFFSIPWFGASVFHIHWTAGITRDAPTEAVASERYAQFIKQLETMRDRGTRVIWTVHNLLPHNANSGHLEIQRRQMLLDVCDAIHVMNDETVPLLQSMFNLGDLEIIMAPHPNYEGAQANFSGALAARMDLGVPIDAYVFLFFGSIQKYKGLENLMKAFDGVSEQSHKPCHLIVAGMPSDPDLASGLELWGGGRDDVTLEVRKIPDDQLQLLFKASDCLVLPYTTTLNSGVLGQAFTFKTPVIGPDIGAFKAFKNKGVATYRAGSVRQLNAAMLDAAAGRLEEAFKIDETLNATLSPDKVSRQFLECVRAVRPKPVADNLDGAFEYQHSELHYG